MSNRKSYKQFYNKEKYAEGRKRKYGESSGDDDDTEGEQSSVVPSSPLSPFGISSSPVRSSSPIPDSSNPSLSTEEGHSSRNTIAELIQRNDESPQLDENIFDIGSDDNELSPEIEQVIDEIVNESFDDSEEEGNESEDDDTEELCPTGDPIPGFLHELTEWSIRYNISLFTMDLLLLILFRHKIIPVKRTARSLRKTPRSVHVVESSNFKFHYFDVPKKIISLLQLYPQGIINNCQDIILQLSTDGLALFKSSKSEMWPILGCITNLLPKRVFPIALGFGEGKPSGLDWLTPAVDQLKALTENGITVFDKHLKVKINSFVADIVARNFIKGTVSHTSKNGCGRCTLEGTYEGKIVYLETIFTKRKDEYFRDERYRASKHQSHTTPLTKLDLNMISGYTCDYMHAVCQGVMKRLVKMWYGEHKDSWLSVKSEKRSLINERLKACKRGIPVDFARKQRTLDLHHFFTATEWRQLMLYTGRLAFKQDLDNDVYKHYLLLSVGMQILLSEKLSEYVKDVHEMFRKFVIDGSTKIYGPGFAVLNVHSLLHLSEDYENYGVLDNCSAFPYENYLGYIKRRIRSGNLPLSQGVKRLEECCKFLSEVREPEIEVTHRSPNNIYIYRDEPFIISQVSDDFVTGTSYNEENTSDFFNFPIESRDVFNYQLCGIGRQLKVPKNSFTRNSFRAMLIVIDEVSYVLGLAH